jgi:hypothetical protein
MLHDENRDHFQDLRPLPQIQAMARFLSFGASLTAPGSCLASDPAEPQAAAFWGR